MASPAHVTADPETLGLTLYIGLSGWPTFRDLDAAARAYARGDDAPLLRLIAENQTGEVGPAGPASAWSRGLFTANVCQDDPTVYDMRAHLRRTAGAARRGRRRQAGERSGDLSAAFDRRVPARADRHLLRELLPALADDPSPLSARPADTIRGEVHHRADPGDQWRAGHADAGRRRRGGRARSSRTAARW